MKRITKNSLRKRILTLLRNQKEDERLVKSQRILKKLFKLKEFRTSSTILFYASFDGEVDTFEMIRQAIKLGKRIGLPKIVQTAKKIIPMLLKNLDRGLVRGPYGIQYPKKGSAGQLDLDEIDLVVVPGVAFDRDNDRLGRGGGYYDRFLKQLPPRVFKVGLAFDFQIVGRLPKKRHDVTLDRVLVG